MSVIECIALTKKFGNTVVLDNMSFVIDENKITGLIGRNGAGKTTLLKLIAGYYKKNLGELRVFDANPFNNLKVSTNMIFIDDSMSFPKNLTLDQIIAHAASIYTNWQDSLAKGLLIYFDFDLTESHNHLSKGMKSTFNMIMGLAAHAPLTIFDEPTTGMDIAVRKDFYRVLLKDYLAHPRTMIISSHLLNELEDILEDILLIKNGQKCLHMPMDELKELALGFRGKKASIYSISNNREIIYQESFGKDGSYIVLKNNFTKVELANAQLTGLEILPVAAEDLCVYMTETEEHKGGIDDVFKRA